MKTLIFTLTSPIHDKSSIEQATGTFLAKLREAGMEHEYVGEDFSRYGEGDLNLIFIRTGGTEGLFLKKTQEVAMLTHAPVYLLASGESNSLAASVEILSWLRSKGMKGSILHGSIEYIAQQAHELAYVERARKTLRGMRAGVIGKPSDWLIASQADNEAVRAKTGIELVNIDIAELIDEINAIRNSGNYNGEPSVSNLHTCDSKYFGGAINIYTALKHLITKHRLNALTLRCFDLLDSVKNTGCLALAMLNSEGIPASCEGDVPALLTMMVNNALTGQTGFQANPSRINPQTGEILFAHCTVPFNMIQRYVYDTHFESGIGVAIHGELPEGAATIVKLSGDMQQWFAEDVTLVKNTYEKQLCRTQIILRTEKAADYLLHRPLGNHQIILTGHHKHMIELFMQK